jgi:membrane-bound lytic murein transglycosylase D
MFRSLTTGLPTKALIALSVAFATACQPTSKGPESTLAAKWIRPVAKSLKPLSSDYALDRDAADFASQTAAVANASECFPMHIRDAGRIGILYLYCSATAQAKDAEGVDISENFSVPDSIARRYNFWRRVYSLWSKDQYVMHLSEYPEVVVEAYDVSRVGEQVGPMAREIMVKKVAKTQRNLYRKLFWTMHANRNKPERFTPAMHRLAAVMAHIPDPNKYATAAQTLRLQRGQRDFVAGGLAVAPKYLGAIEAEFKAQGIPVEITRLAFVESSFNLKARSKVGASGVYQIMPATGRQYLKMHSGVDERNDPIKASRAAAKLLRLNYNLTGAWPLAITAYNHGVGGIRRAVNATGSKDIAVLINRYRGNQFGFASKNFYASFLGVLATLKDADRLFPEVPKVMPIAFNNVRLTKPTSLAVLKKQYQMTSTEVAEFNPDITYGMIRTHGTLPRGYVLKVPARGAAPTPIGIASFKPNS